MALGFMLLVSLLFTTILAALTKYIGGWLPEVAVQALGFHVSFAFTTLIRHDVQMAPGRK